MTVGRARIIRCSRSVIASWSRIRRMIATIIRTGVGIVHSLDSITLGRQICAARRRCHYPAAHWVTDEDKEKCSSRKHNVPHTKSHSLLITVIPVDVVTVIAPSVRPITNRRWISMVDDWWRIIDDGRRIIYDWWWIIGARRIINRGDSVTVDWPSAAIVPLATPSTVAIINARYCTFLGSVVDLT
jgi:hypothetical protein